MTDPWEDPPPLPKHLLENPGTLEEECEACLSAIEEVYGSRDPNELLRRLYAGLVQDDDLRKGTE